MTGAGSRQTVFPSHLGAAILPVPSVVPPCHWRSRKARLVGVEVPALQPLILSSLSGFCGAPNGEQEECKGSDREEPPFESLSLVAQCGRH